MKIKLKNIVNMSTGYQVRCKLNSDDNGTHKIIQMRNICTHSGVLSSEENEYDSVTPKNPERYELKLNDIILMTRGNFNKASIITKNNIGLIASGHFMILRIKENLNILPEYLHLFLNLKSTSKYFEHEARGTGIKILSKITVGELDIPISAINIQKGIINYHKIANNELELLLKLAKKKKKLTDAVLSKMINNTN